MSESPKSFFSTLPGVLTGLASLIAAITGLYVATDGFSFSHVKQSIESPQDDSAAQHQRQIENLKRQAELEELQREQEKKRLIAAKELADLKAENDRLAKEQSRAIVKPTVVQTKELTGKWSVTNVMGTYLFHIDQQEDKLTLQVFDSMGNNVGSGGGSINNKQVYLHWVEPYLFIMTIEVEANLTLSANGSKMTGPMLVDGNTVDISLFRQ